MLEPFLEGQTLDEALAAKRIFIVDLGILSRLKLDEPRKVGINILTPISQVNITVIIKWSKIGNGKSNLHS